jgi:ribonuclease P protein component
MLPKKKRIPRSLFPLLLKEGKTFKNDLFLVKIAFDKVPGGKFSFSISKKIAKSAVVRNKMRRWGYHFIQNHLNMIPDALLANFSFRKMPKNKGEVFENLTLIIRNLEKNKK